MMISNRMIFYSLDFCGDKYQNIWFIVKSSSHPSVQCTCKICFKNRFWGQPVDSNYDFNLCRESSVDLKLTFSSGMFNKHEICLMNHQMHY